MHLAAGDGGMAIADIAMARLSGSISSLPECIYNKFDISGCLLLCQIEAKAVHLICDTPSLKFVQ